MIHEALRLLAGALVRLVILVTVLGTLYFAALKIGFLPLPESDVGRVAGGAERGQAQ